MSDGRRRFKVMMLTTTLPARPGDGTPEFVLTLARALAKQHDITIVAPRVRGAASSETIDGVKVVRFRYFFKRWERLAEGAILPNLRSSPILALQIPSLMVSLLWATRRVEKRTGPDVLHAHWLLPSGLVLRILARNLGRPYVVTAHGADGYALEGRAFRWLKRTIIRRAAVISPVSRELGLRLGLDDAYIDRTLAPMGVDRDEITQATGGRSPEPGRFLFVGRLESKKGVDVLLRAIAGVDKAELDVIGDGSDRPALGELADSLGLGPRVRFHGSQPREKVLSALRTAYALVIPSKIGKGGDTDGTPVVLGEAMAAGVPVIASRIGGLEDHVVSGDNGLLVDPDSVESLRAGLDRALTSPDEVRSWARAAEETVERWLDVKVTAQTYSRLYEEALAKG